MLQDCKKVVYLAGLKEFTEIWQISSKIVATLKRQLRTHHNIPAYYTAHIQATHTIDTYDLHVRDVSTARHTLRWREKLER